MIKISERLFNKGYLWFQKKAEVARFHGIILADLREKSRHFQTVLLESLQLIYDHDPLRFSRVQRHIRWIVNRDLALGRCAEYNAGTQTCSIDFYEPKPTDDQSWHQTWLIARNAKILVHEATHGVLLSRGIAYTSKSHVRVEELCVLEENRFVRRVVTGANERSQSELATVMECLQSNFDPEAWEKDWTASRWRRALSLMRHLRSA